MADQQSVSPLTESELRSLLSHISALRGVPMYEHLEALLAEQQGDRNAKHLQNIARAALSDEAAESQVAELKEALRELVRLKDGPRDEAYTEAKDFAWDRARAALATQGESDA